eukprot:8928159-Pyramimonas_sp.AAC.1
MDQSEGFGAVTWTNRGRSWTNRRTLISESSTFLSSSFSTRTLSDSALQPQSREGREHIPRAGDNGVRVEESISSRRGDLGDTHILRGPVMKAVYSLTAALRKR